MKQILLVLVTFSLSLDAMAQAKPTEEQIGRAYGQAVTKATLLGETLVLMEKQCPKLATATDYREILAKDRAQVAKLEPKGVRPKTWTGLSSDPQAPAVLDGTAEAE